MDQTALRVMPSNIKILIFFFFLLKFLFSARSREAATNLNEEPTISALAKRGRVSIIYKILRKFKL